MPNCAWPRVFSTTSRRAGIDPKIFQSLGSFNVTCGGAPAYVWPGGGITVMVDVMRMPDKSFGTVPTPAIVAPIEFSMTQDDYQRLGGHVDHIRSLAQVLKSGAWHNDGAPVARLWVQNPANNPWPLGQPPLLG